MREFQIKNVKIGSDPEFFIWSDSLNKFIPSCGLIGGTKKDPIPISQDGHFIQEDNVLCEFNIPPCTNSEDFIKHINFVKDYINETILVPKGLMPKYQASAIFEYDDLQSPQALEFGCTPDYNAWTKEENIVGRDNLLLRTAGTHIHVGYDDPDLDTNVEIIKAMDLFLGTQSILLDRDEQRRIMYGKAGAYRHKKFGVEYRVLSGFVIANDKLIKWAFDNTIKAIEFVNSGGIITNEDEIINCINNSDVDLAKEILDDYNIEILKEEELFAD